MIRNNLIIFLFILFIAGCTSKKESDTDKSTPSIDVANVSEVIDVTKRADMAPNFTWKDKDGKTIDFDSFKGKVTLINFWATWCGPCKRELPDLISLSKEMSDKNVKILGISTDRGANVIEDLRSFVAEKGIPYQIVIANDDLEEAFGNVRLIPTTFIVDETGKIIQTIVGARSKEQFKEAIIAILE